MEGLSNKTALVTGGSFGIGRATAIAFAKAGANVVIADWVEDSETVNQIQKLGGNAAFIKIDISNEDDVKRMVKFAIDKFGSIDFAFNNAGVEGEQAATHECTTENWDKTIGINLKGTWLCMKHDRRFSGN